MSATLLGFTPGTLAIVYAGTAGKVSNNRIINLYCSSRFLVCFVCFKLSCCDDEWNGILFFTKHTLTITAELSILNYYKIVQAIFSKGLGDFPWYSYVGAAGIAVLFGRAVTRFANDLMKSAELDSPAATVTTTTSPASSAEESGSKGKL